MKRPPGNDLGIGTISGTDVTLAFPTESRDKHLYVCGATGTGKSKFLEHLIRQDILLWHKSKCGLLLLDPHGSLYDSIMQWMANSGATHVPIIPIDLRQDEWVVCYNALRRRDIPDCSVPVENFVQAMAHVWGQGGTDNTPRFARWAANILRTLYENDLTLLESEYLIDHLDKMARHILMQKVTDRASKRDWQFANELKPREFEAELGSTANRLQRFLRNKRMRAIFGQSTVSMDLGKALHEGHIILVSLASAGARVSEEDADVFANLLLSDLWTAALERGKKPGVKPFYCYLDECQRFVTPTIARNLDEARGFGLHITMGNQFPQQLLRQGEEGAKLYDSIFENASSKVCFRLSSEENLKPMAQWLFRGVMDPNEVKLQLESTKVVRYQEVTRTSRTMGASKSMTTTHTEGESEGESEDQRISGDIGKYVGHLHIRSVDRLMLRARKDQDIDLAMGAGRSTNRQRSDSRAEGDTASYSETTSQVLIPVIGSEISHVQYRSLEEQLHRAMSVLFDQKQRQGVVRLVGMKAPVSIHTPHVEEKKVGKAQMKRYVAKLMTRWNFALPSWVAQARLTEREKDLEKRFRELSPGEEPDTSRRRISP